MTRLVRTELLKQRTLPTFVVGVAAAPVIAALVVVAVFGAAGKDGNDPLGPDSFVQVLGAPSSIITALALLLGVLAMTGEHRHETITTTFLACPRRRDVVVAKLVAQTLVGAGMGLLTLVTTVAVAVPWLRMSDVTVQPGGAAVRVATGLVLSSALFGSLGVAVGAIVRNQTAAAAAVLVWLLAVEGILTDVFADAAFSSWLPAAAGRAMVHGSTSSGQPSLAGAAAALAVYVAALAVAGTVLTVRRDVT
jgi:ABC-2 type transport system permease protein